MGRRDREQTTDRGNTDVVKDERGRGQEVGRGPYEPTRDKAKGTENLGDESRPNENDDELEGSEEDEVEFEDDDEFEDEDVEQDDDEDADEDEGDDQISGEIQPNTSSRADRGANPTPRYSVGLKNPSQTGGKVGRAAERRDRSGDPEKP